MKIISTGIVVRDLSVYRGSVSIAETQSEIFGGGILVRDGGSASISGVSFFSCAYGGVHALGSGASVSLSGVRIDGSLGLGAVASRGAALAASNSTVSGTAAAFSGDASEYDLVWAAACGNLTTEQSCDQVTPPEPHRRPPRRPARTFASPCMFAQIQTIQAGLPV